MLTLVAELIQAEIPASRPVIVVIDPDNAAGPTVAVAPGIAPRVWPAIERQAIRTTIADAASGHGPRPDHERRVVVTPDVAEDPSWDDWRESAAQFNLVSSWSMAIVGAGNAVLGALVLYFPSLAHPSRAGLQTLGDAGQLAAAAVQHVSRRQQQREHIRTDSLTGLPNRVVLLERLRVAQQRTSGTDGYFAVVQLAVDGLAQVNETLGEPAGDDVLRQAAHRLIEVAGPAATVAHVWGVEFAVLIEDLDSTAAANEVAARLGAACREPFDVDGLAVSVGATIGLVAYSQDTAPGGLLIEEPAAAGARRGTPPGVRYRGVRGRP